MQMQSFALPVVFLQVAPYNFTPRLDEVNSPTTRSLGARKEHGAGFVLVAHRPAHPTNLVLLKHLYPFTPLAVAVRILKLRGCLYLRASLKVSNTNSPTFFIFSCEMLIIIFNNIKFVIFYMSHTFYYIIANITNLLYLCT